MPNTPAESPSIKVSAVKRLETSRLRPPSERMTPISFIRSTTETYVIMPIITDDTIRAREVKETSAIVMRLTIVRIMSNIIERMSLYIISSRS